MATIAIESAFADIMPVTKLVAPGPDVARQIPGLPVTREYASAAWAADSSWRTNT